MTLILHVFLPIYGETGFSFSWCLDPHVWPPTIALQSSERPFRPKMRSNLIGRCKWSVRSWGDPAERGRADDCRTGWCFRKQWTDPVRFPIHWSVGLSSPPSALDAVVVENSVTRRASGFVLFKSSMADTLAPPPEDLLPFFWSRAMKFSLRDVDLWLLPRVRFRMSLPLVLCFTGDTRLWRLPKESDGSLRPRTFLLDLKEISKPLGKQWDLMHS